MTLVINNPLLVLSCVHLNLIIDYFIIISFLLSNLFGFACSHHIWFD